jgi:uracil phosphoribosyltransferase
VIAPFTKTRRITAHSVSRETESTFAVNGNGNGNAMPAPRAGAIKNINVVDHPIARHALAALRNRETGPEQFRIFCSHLLVLLAIESTRTLPTRKPAVGAVSGPDGAQMLEKPVVFLSLSRHGLGLAHQVADFIPNLSVGLIHLGQSGNGQLLEPRMHLVNAPALSDARVILFNPVVATGLSTSVALNLLRSSNAEDITLLSFLTSAAGLDRVLRALPVLIVWTAAVDSDWDSKRDSLPSLGNFGERLYG